MNFCTEPEFPWMICMYCASKWRMSCFLDASISFENIVVDFQVLVDETFLRFIRNRIWLSNYAFFYIYFHVRWSNQDTIFMLWLLVCSIHSFYILATTPFFYPAFSLQRLSLIFIFPSLSGFSRFHIFQCHYWTSMNAISTSEVIKAWPGRLNFGAFLQPEVLHPVLDQQFLFEEAPFSIV